MPVFEAAILWIVWTWYLTLTFAESKESTRPIVLTRKKLGQGKWIILLCLTEGRVQNGRRTSKNFEILWTLPWLMTLTLVPKKRSYNQKKYTFEISITHHSKIMANVQVFIDKYTERAKHYDCLWSDLSWGMGGGGGGGVVCLNHY